jgi:hypothetical protein
MGFHGLLKETANFFITCVTVASKPDLLTCQISILVSSFHWVGYALLWHVIIRYISYDGGCYSPNHAGGQLLFCLPRLVIKHITLREDACSTHNLRTRCRCTFIHLDIDSAWPLNDTVDLPIDWGLCISACVNAMLRGSLVTTARRVLRLRMEKMASRYGGVAANILKKKSRLADKGWSPAWVLGVGLTTPPRQKSVCYEMSQRASDLEGRMDSYRLDWAGSGQGPKEGFCEHGNKLSVP